MDGTPAPDDRVLETVAELFGLLSAPVRLKIIGAVCQDQRKHVGELFAELDTTQPDMSQRPATADRSGVLGRRREGTRIDWRLRDPSVATPCRTVGTQVTIGMDVDRAQAAAVPARSARRA